jgi:hypothetical protein
VSLFYPANPVAEVRRVAVCRIVAVDGRVQNFEKMKEGKEPLATPGPYPLSATFLGCSAWPWSWPAAVGFLLFCLIKSKRGNAGKTCPGCALCAPGALAQERFFDISRQHHTAQWQHLPAHRCYHNARHVRGVIRDLGSKDGDPFNSLNSRFAVSRNWLSQQTQ